MEKTRKSIKISQLSDDGIHWSAYNRCKALKKYIPEYVDDIIIGQVNGSKENLKKKIKEGNLIHIQYVSALKFFEKEINEQPDKFIITFANERSYYHNYGGQRKYVVNALKKCKYFTSNSKKLAKELKIPYIPNGVDLDLFKNPKKPVIGYVGTEKENKNYPLFLEACEKCKVEPFKFTYLKRIPHEQMPSKYREMTCLIHPSKTEGCNNVVLEALTMNVPVYMTREGMWEELEGYVHFIEPTLEGITKVIKKHCGNEFIRDNYSWEQMAKKYKKFYESIDDRINQQM